MAVIGESGSGKSTLTRLIAGWSSPPAAGSRWRAGHPGSGPGRWRRPRSCSRTRPGRSTPTGASRKASASPCASSTGHNAGPPWWRCSGRVGIDPARPPTAPGASAAASSNGWPSPAPWLPGRASCCATSRPRPSMFRASPRSSGSCVTSNSEIGFSCIFVTHDLAVAQVVADHVLVLRHGQAQGIRRGATALLRRAEKTPIAGSSSRPWRTSAARRAPPARRTATGPACRAALRRHTITATKKGNS